ncbi:MAG TPA: hypothetical protein VH436_18820 [Vicinamibacterales bacterium]
MTLSALRAVVLAIVFACAAACSRPAPSPSGPPAIRLSTPSSGRAVVEVVNLPSDTIASLTRARLTPARWPSVLHVAVDAQSPPVLGEYVIDDGVVRFTPAFPFDPGRQYDVRFDPSSALGDEGARGEPIVATVKLPRRDVAPSTVVRAIYPSGDLIPENQLRMYIEFSAPMGLRSGIDYLALLDERGTEVPGPFLPLDYEFWNRDHTRFTVFFDPGRVKDGILPNRQMGRALKAGHTYTLVVRPEWHDANGAPLKEAFRRTFRVGPADTQPLDPASWHIDSPKAGARVPLVVTFPEPLDHGLLLRALGVRQAGQALEGDISIEANETRWTFTPHDPWRAGAYDLLALSILEDRAGNQIGRAFEVDNFDTVDKGPEPKTITLPFRLQ